MGLFDKLRSKGETYDGQGDERKGLIDNVFVNLEKGCLVHRYPYDNLSTCAKITVQEGQQMVFLSEGQYSNLFLPGQHTISTNNIPFLEKIVNLPYGGGSAFKTTLYVINTTRQRLAGEDAGWGVGLTIRDYTFGDEGVTIKVGAFGSYEFRITNAIAFIREYMGTLHEMYLEDFCSEFTSAVSQRVVTAINRYFSKNHTGITEINNYLFEVAEFSRREINEYFEDYGLELTKFDIEGINPHEDDPNYQRIIAAQNEAATMDLESRATVRKRQREGYSYQQERQFDILQSAAGNEGMAGSAMGAGMGMGMGFGIGGVMGQQMGSVAQGSMQATAQTPPPPVALQMYLYLNNQQAGPYDMPILQQLASQGILTPQTLVWRAGMTAWAQAGSVSELQTLFAPTPPPVPGTPPTPPMPPSM